MINSPKKQQNKRISEEVREEFKVIQFLKSNGLCLVGN